MALIPTPQQERARMLQDTMAQLIGQSAGLDAQRPTLQTGLLEGNQDSLKDVITDPSPSQINTVMGALISGLAGKSTAGSVARGLATGAATRGNQFGRELAAHEAERLSLKDRIAQIKGLHEVSTSQGNLDVSRGSLDVSRSNLDISRDRLNETISQNAKNLLSQVNAVIPQPDGSVKTIAVQKDKEGRFYDIQGNRITLPQGTRLGTVGKTAADIEEGGFGLTTAQEGQAQKRILTAKKQLREIEKLTSEDFNKFLSVKGRTISAIGKGMDFAQGVGGEKAAALSEALTGVDPVEFAAQSRVIFERLANFFNEYRKDITGAAAAFVELENLKKGVLNGDLPPAQATASLAALIERTVGNIDADVQALGGGVRGNDDKVQRIRRLLNEP